MPVGKAADACSKDANPGDRIYLSSIEMVLNKVTAASIGMNAVEAGIVVRKKLVIAASALRGTALGLHLVAEYQAATKTAVLTLRAGLGDGKYQPLPFSFGSLECYANAIAFAEVLSACLKTAAEKLAVDLGGLKLRMSASSHQASEQVFFTVVRDGRWVPLANWKALK